MSVCFNFFSFTSFTSEVTWVSMPINYFPPILAKNKCASLSV